MQTILLRFANNPVFDRSNIDRALTNLPVPPIDSQYVDRIIDYAVEKDWGHSGQ
ncbi:MAG: hypothetical protein WC647_11240 [Desulfomonilaceae bacterium]